MPQGVEINPGFFDLDNAPRISYQRIGLKRIPTGDTVTKKHKKIALASSNFVGSFKAIYPDLHIFDPENDSVRSYDLFIFPGGEDVSPYYYRQENHYCYGVNEIRDNQEYNLLNKALSSGKKVFGVCRGLQLFSVFLGMSLTQDIRIELNAKHTGYHPLNWNTPGILHKYFSGGMVNSLHHQGVFIDQVHNIEPACFYDQVLEGFESDRIIAVQWHPEFMVTEKADPIYREFFQFLSEEW